MTKETPYDDLMQQLIEKHEAAELNDRLARVFQYWAQRHYPDRVWVRLRGERPRCDPIALAAVTGNIGERLVSGPHDVDTVDEPAAA